MKPLHEEIKKAAKECILEDFDAIGMMCIVTDYDHLIPLVILLKDRFGFQMFLDVTAVDYPEREYRFEVVYHFLSVASRERIRVKLKVKEVRPNVPTLRTLFGSAYYMERETHEMYGIVFDGNDDLRPILLYEEFVGYPLRKDYPIAKEQPRVEYRK
ncbi:NADH-quinone oxidoreductase subunit C [Deltaproteobacteria bacterium TL4]